MEDRYLSSVRCYTFPFFNNNNITTSVPTFEEEIPPLLTDHTPDLSPVSDQNSSFDTDSLRFFQLNTFV